MRSMQAVPIPAFADNYIWAVDDGSRAVVVDPGEAAPVIDYLQRRGLALTAILITHHHPDHIGGVGQLLEYCTGAGIALQICGPDDPRIGMTHRVLGEGARVELPALALTFDVLDVPGHTLSHIAYVGYVDGQARWLFCGDTLFATGCGRMFEGNAKQMNASLARLASLPADLNVCCAHEYTLANIRFALLVDPHNAALRQWQTKAQALRDAGCPTLPTTLGHERATNPFLRLDDPQIANRLDAQAMAAGQQKPESAAQRFSVLRSWKDDFRG